MSIPFKSNQEKLTVLQKVEFGQRVAEDEVDLLASYFVETESWRQIFEGKVDIVYGAKGVGKSALYSLLMKRDGDLFSRNILLAPAENPRGTPVFADLVTDPPSSERELQGFWKLYFVSIIYSALTDYALSGSRLTEVRDALTAEGLVRGSASLKALLATIVKYAKKFFRPDSIEGGVEIDPVSGLPKDFHGKICFSEAGTPSSDQNAKSVDELLSILNGVLRENDQKVWILLDRLDVAFAEHPNLEANALKGLFRVYLDLLGFEFIKLKIFLRSDIWKRITEQGFREASHITRTLTIDWEQKSLLNLVVRTFIPHVGAYRQARSPSYNDSYGGLEPALAPRAFPKGTLHLNGEPIASPGGPLGKAGREIPQGTTAGNSTKLGLFAPASATISNPFSFIWGRLSLPLETPKNEVYPVP